VALTSVKELEGTDYPDALYLIILLNAYGVLELRGFYLRDKKLMRFNYQYEQSYEYRSA